MDPGCLSCIGMLFGSLRTGDIRKFCQVTGRESTPRTTAVFNIARGRFSNTEAALATSEGSSLRKRFVFDAIMPASAVGTTIVVDLVLRDDNWLASNLVWMPAKGHPMVLMGEVPQAELMALARDARSKKRRRSRPFALKRPLAIGALVAAICLSFYFGVNYFGQRVPSSDAEARASAETMKSGSKGKADLKTGSAKKASSVEEPGLKAGARPEAKEYPSARKGMKAVNVVLRANKIKAPVEDDRSGQTSTSVAHKADESNSSRVSAKNQEVQGKPLSEASQQITMSQITMSQTPVVEVKASTVSTKQTITDVVKPQKPSAKFLPNNASVAKSVVKPVVKQLVTSTRQSAINTQKVQGKLIRTPQTSKTAVKFNVVKVMVQESQSAPPPAPTLPSMPKPLKIQQEPSQEEMTDLELPVSQPPVPMVQVGESSK